jgi:hypothetical protein
MLCREHSYRSCTNQNTLILFLGTIRPVRQLEIAAFVLQLIEDRVPPSGLLLL